MSVRLMKVSITARGEQVIMCDQAVTVFNLDLVFKD